MKFRLALLLMLCLCLPFAAAQAYTTGEMIELDGFSGQVAYVASDGDYMLVEVDGLGMYLLGPHTARSGGTICGAIPASMGDQLSVRAVDKTHCEVTRTAARETLVYHFAYTLTESGEEEWILERYERRTAEGTTMAELSHLRADVTQTAQGETQTATVYYDFFRQANNLNHGKLPGTIEQAMAFEACYPVAAVSPDDPASRVNLREGPSTKTARCGSLYSGVLLRIREVKDGFARVQIGDGDAWISTDYLTFGALIETVPDMRPTVTLRGEPGEWIEASRRPYRGGGGTVMQTQAGCEVRIAGEYNDEWRIVDKAGGTIYVRAGDVR